jgi:hypothetical protein
MPACERRRDRDDCGNEGEEQGALGHGANLTPATRLRKRVLKNLALSADTRSAVAITLISLVTFLLIGGAVVLFSRARRAARVDARAGLVSRADTQRYLAENWALVEESARESGMSDVEIAQVRAKILGIS